MSDILPIIVAIYAASIFFCFIDQTVSQKQAIIVTISIFSMIFVMYRVSPGNPPTCAPPITTPEALTPETAVPSFDYLVNNAIDEPMEATPEEKKKLHTTKDQYEFLETQPEYKGKDEMYYANKGDLINREWTSKYTILDTKHWKPYIAPPPVCLGKDQACDVCPTVMHQPYLDLSEFSKTKAIIPTYSA